MPSVAAGLLVFFTSASVLVLEILAGRMLAPYVGVTLQTYTGVIGTVLAGISLGSWGGGWIADRMDPRKLLGPLVTTGGVLSMVSPLAVAIFGAGMVGGGPVDIVGLAFLGFFLPAVVLSAVSPTIVKLQLGDLRETGTVVGRLAALGTFGAIVGTFVTGFLLISAFKTASIAFGLGIALMTVGVVLWWVLEPERRRDANLVLAMGVLGGALTLLLRSPCTYESAYFCARVLPDPARPSGRILQMDTLRHSYVDLDDPTYLDFSYTRTISDVLATVAPPGRPIAALSIGGGGFSLPRYILATRPGSTNVVLELDPGLVRLAQQRLGLVLGEDLQVRTGDARMTLRELPPSSYDVAIGDAFGGLAVPWHLTTQEFLGQVKERLRPRGVYVMNLIDNPPIAFVRAETKTVRQVFGEVAVIGPAERLAGTKGGNFIVVASDAPLDLDGILAHDRARGGNEEALTGVALNDFVGGAPLLTDAHAPVDQLIRR